MRWNRNGKTLASNLQGNVFYGIMPQARQLMFRRAFGLENSKAPTRKPRDKLDKLGTRKGPAMSSYQEDFIESREYVEGIFDVWAHQLNIGKSNVVQAFITNSPGRLAQALQRNYDKRKLKDPVLGAAPDDWHEPIMESFRKSIGVLTDFERQKAGKDAELAKLREADAAKSKGFKPVTSNPNAMKGVKVTNKKQGARQKLTAGA